VLAVAARVTALTPQDPLRALVPIDVNLAGRIPATIEIPPVKGVVSHALVAGLVLKRTTDLLATFAAVRAGFPVFPGRVDLNQGQIRPGHGRSGESDRGSELSLEIAEGHGVGINDQAWPHVSIFPKPQGSKKIITEKGGEKVKPNPGCDPNGQEADEAEARPGPCHFLDLTQKSRGKRLFEFYNLPCMVLHSFHLASDPISLKRLLVKKSVGDK
jgi:hypothetical protein